MLREHARREERQTAALLYALGIGSACWIGGHSAADLGVGDAGEIGGAAWTLGVAHPTGFPLDMLLLRAATLLPLGTIAFRQNLGVGLINACVVLCLTGLAERLARRVGVAHEVGRAAGAALTAAAMLSSRTVLGSALSVEVYGTALLCVVSAAWLLEQPDPVRARLLWPLLGCAAGTHITAALLMAPLLVARALVDRWWRGRTWLAAGLCSLMTAALIVYLPLATRRDGPFDWGDPETLAALWRHLSAARIREAYIDKLWDVARAPGVQLLTQLAEQPLFLLPAGYGVIVLWRSQRAAALCVLTVFSLDLGYGTWINPMGIVDRQVGHACWAVIALTAGIGAASLLNSLLERSRPACIAAATVTLMAAAHVLTAAQRSWVDDDGYAVSERYGALSPLIDLPARAVYVCESDSGCAASLFAVYAEGTRPDLAVVPAQHLWDRTVLRRLSQISFGDAQAAAASPRQRRELAVQRLRALASQHTRRPIYYEHLPPSAAGPLDTAHAPIFGLSAEPRSTTHSVKAHETARFGAEGADTALSRELWSNAYEREGAALLRQREFRAAVLAFTRAAQLTPQRAVAHTNLGVALERDGQLEAAALEAQRAITLDPQRPTAWLNLARLMLTLRGPEAARRIIQEAQRRELDDARLQALARALDTDASAQGATAK